MKKLFLLVASGLSFQIAFAQSQTNQTNRIEQTNQTNGVVQTNQVVLEVYQDPKAPLEKRVDDLFGRLTEDEKLKLLGGTGFTTQPIERLGVPAMGMVDAGQGVRGGSQGTQGPATAFPAGVTMASTWDTNLIGRVGEAIGVEARNKGTGAQVLLGPAVNIHRSPLGGRNGEYMTEDPYLAARMAVSYIEGMQASGVSACIKHYACNNQEDARNGVNVEVSERALREIYLPAFEAGVTEAKVWCVMSSYNLVNGYHSSANHYLLTDVLKNDWGFDGTVMSDWGGVHETDVVQAGNDLEMPDAKNMTVAQLQTALSNGSVTQAAIDDSVRRILRTVIRVGLLDGPLTQDHSKVNSREHDELAYEVAAKSIVLLKNDHNILPLNREKIKSIALIGEAGTKLQVDALGSPRVRPLKTTEIIDGLKDRAGASVQIRYVTGLTDGDLIPASAVTVPNDSSAHGFHAEYFKNATLSGEPALVRTDKEINLEGDSGAPAKGISGRVFSVRWTANLSVPATGAYVLAFTGDDGFRVYLDDNALIDKWDHGAPTTRTNEVKLEAGKTYALRVEFFQDGGDYVARLAWKSGGKPNYADSVEAAKSSDVAIVCVSTMNSEGEGNDRPSMDLPANQAALIRAVAAVNQLTNLSHVSYNATLYYEDSVLSARISAAYRSKYLTVVPGRNGADVEGTAATMNVDASATYHLDGHFDLTLEAINLTNQDQDLYFDSSRLLFSDHFTGREFLLGIRYSY